MKIPPLNPLKVFEVAARTSNLTMAANELLVSQSAVSRQISVLEEYLGVQLFTRERVGVKLTEVGEVYAQRIGPAFEEISEATKFITQMYVYKLGFIHNNLAKFSFTHISFFRCIDMLQSIYSLCTILHFYYIPKHFCLPYFTKFT